jgi:hypothetical protein
MKHKCLFALWFALTCQLVTAQTNCSLQPRGPWIQGVAYTCGTVVSYGTCSWMARVKTTGTPGMTAAWQKVACDGIKGTDGTAATVTIEPTITAPAGTPASVQNMGDSHAADLKFTIPVGKNGIDGKDSTVAGPQGISAYQVALANGFSGTEQEWLASLKGDPGPSIPGLSYSLNPDGSTSVLLNGSLSTTNATGDHSIVLGKWRCAPSATGLFLCAVAK